MQTLPLWGYEVEENDYLVLGGDLVGQVTEKNDEGDGILFTCKDDEGEVTQYPIGPFDSVAIVAAFEDDVEFEDVPIE